MIRWLVVGSGRAGRCHLAAIEQVPQAALAGVVTLDPPPPGVSPVYGRIADAVAEARPDGIILATPHATHLPLALEVIQLGLPVLCEKPVGRNAGEAEQILAAATAAGVTIGVVLNQRGTAHHRWIRALIDAGELTPLSIAFAGTLGRLRGWNADPAQSGGGVLRVIGLHYLDLLRWWLGEPERIVAVTGGGACEDRAAVALGFANDVLGSVHLTAAGVGSLEPVRCVIEAPPARIVLRGHLITRSEGLPDPPAAEADDPALLFGPGHRTVLADASAALLEHRPLPVTLADALPSLALVDEAYAATGGGSP